ncbi:MAG: helix-turn-helix domain-containing protein [Rhodothermales bacterium]|nr:helix-turn-helix domain-containing protein [Rhodothermales bacterium]MCA0270362.1 helix-turn-helix domain-containing protein [Bacteroidota bacterium]
MSTTTPEHSAPAAHVPRVAASYDEIAAALGVTRKTVEAMVTRGELSALPVGRRRVVPRASLVEAFGADTAEAILTIPPRPSARRGRPRSSVATVEAA